MTNVVFRDMDATNLRSRAEPPMILLGRRRAIEQPELNILRRFFCLGLVQMPVPIR